MGGEISLLTKGHPVNLLIGGPPAGAPPLFCFLSLGGGAPRPFFLPIRRAHAFTGRKIESFQEENQEQWRGMPPKVIRGRRVMANMQNKIREAMDAGRTAQSRGKSEARFIELLTGEKVVLQNNTGQATEAGQAYYGILGVPVPKLYNYEEPLIND